MNRTTTFTKGSGVYACRCCGRSTRDDGNGDSVHIQLCTQCFDLGGGLPGVWDDLLRKIDALSKPKVVQLDTIAPSLQRDMISSFWSMLQMAEAQVNNGEGRTVTKHWVECWYKQWNSITGDDKKPKWLL